MYINIGAIPNQDINEFCFLQFTVDFDLLNDVQEIMQDCNTEEHISLKLDDNFFRPAHYLNWDCVRTKMKCSTLFTKQYCLAKYQLKTVPKNKTSNNKIFINKYGFYFVSQCSHTGINYQTLDFDNVFIENLKAEPLSLVS
jgi:hypothetical protein